MVHEMHAQHCVFLPPPSILLRPISLLFALSLSLSIQPPSNSIYACRVRCIFIFLLPSSFLVDAMDRRKSPTHCVGSTSTQNMPFVRSTHSLTHFHNISTALSAHGIRQNTERQNHATTDNLSFRCNRSIFSSFSVLLLLPSSMSPSPSPST